MTWRSPIFRKLLFTALALLAVALLSLDFYLSRYIGRRETLGVERRLAAQARLLAEDLAAVPPAGLETWVRRADARAQARITVIDPAGRVLADSEHAAESMENHSGRPEVSQARNGHSGVSIRHSSTLNTDFCYFALPVSYGGKPGYALRLAVPLRELSEAIAEVRWRMLLGSLVAAAFGLVLAYLVSRTIARRIRRLQSYAEGLLDSRFAQSLAPEASDELGDLARSLSHMAARSYEMVDRLSVESARRDAILSSMVEGVLAVDHELHVTFCNESFARAVGARHPVPERLPLLELVRSPHLLEMLTRALVTGEQVKGRLELISAPSRAYEAQVAPIEVRSRRGAIAVLHDISDLERLERVRKDFVANVSHELRTPLAAIRGYAETLLDGALEDAENNRQFVEVIRAHAMRLTAISSDLLVLSDLESGRQAPAPERISVRAVLETVLRTVEAEARTRRVELCRDEVEDLYVEGHPLRLEQALLNLVDNAVKFNRPGGEVRLEARRESEGKVRIAISDTGIGIPSEDLPRIFERFYRVDKARSREVGGTGLGLSIVRHVIERMQGSVTAESQLGKGSRFTVVLPAAQ